MLRKQGKEPLRFVHWQAIDPCGGRPATTGRELAAQRISALAGRQRRAHTDHQAAVRIGVQGGMSPLGLLTGLLVGKNTDHPSRP